LVRNGANGELRAFNGDGAGGGQWLATGFTASLAGDNQTQNWIRLTVRLDFARKTWDLYAGGTMVAADLNFRDNTRPTLALFSVQGHAAAATRLDYLLAAADNPLFADADKDGMDDAWETANGLNPAVNDRDGDLDGDGLSNIREYQLRLKPNNPDSDGDGLFDGDEVFWGWGPLTPNPDTTPPTAPAGLTANATTDTVNLTWQSATDNLRVSGYLVYRNGQLLETLQPVRDTHYTDTGLPDNESFGYQVRAFDFSGNLSPPSERVAVRTAAADKDGNGLPDYWEQKYFPQGGVDPNADGDGDGITNIQEYRNGTDPTDFYNGVVPTHDVLYGGRPGPNDQLAMIVRKPDGAPWPNAPVDFDITSGRRRISAVPDGPYSYRVTVRADADGLAQCYLEPLSP
jgi:chitodextrinase